MTTFGKLLSKYLIFEVLTCSDYTHKSVLFAYYTSRQLRRLLLANPHIFLKLSIRDSVYWVEEESELLRRINDSRVGLILSDNTSETVLLKQAESRGVGFEQVLIKSRVNVSAKEQLTNLKSYKFQTVLIDVDWPSEEVEKFRESYKPPMKSDEKYLMRPDNLEIKATTMGGLLWYLVWVMPRVRLTLDIPQELVRPAMEHLSGSQASFYFLHVMTDTLDQNLLDFI